MDNIRKETFLGNEKIIVGSKYSDLVLETLGKVYIKTGNSSRVLSDVLALLDKATESSISSQTIIVGSLQEMQDMEYPGDGFFVYNTLTTTLYISYDERYIALIEASEGAKDGYVRRSGDTMSGQLEINTIGPPLIVASSKLVNNLNAEYINGYSSDELAKKKVDEYITGNWTFKGKGVSDNNWTFNQNVRMYGDLITSRSIGTPEFASGFGGYGWRIDGDTNALTVDYLIVRKAMRVYEMVINKISATNGSLWVSNSSKCTAAYQPIIITNAELTATGAWGTEDSKNNLIKLFPPNNYFLFNDITSNYDITEPFTTQISDASGNDINAKTFIDYKFIIFIKDINVVVASTLFKGVSSLYDETILDSSWESYHGANPSGVTQDEYLKYKSNIKIIYITKSKEVTEWATIEGDALSGTTPKTWTNIDTFNKKTPFYMVPKSRELNFKKDGKFSESISNLYCMYPYYKYFGIEGSETNIPKISNIWVVECKNDDYPYFKPGDIVRCQKYNNGNIKYYDAVVTTQVDSYTYIMQKAVSVFDKYTEISYDEEGNVTKYIEDYNNTQYNKTEKLYDSNTNEYSSYSSTEDRLDDISKDDDMVQMGNIFNIERQNAVYITSTDDCGPFIDVMSGLNRPDYLVLYITPTWGTKKASIKKKGDIYVKEGASDFFYQTTNPGSVNPHNFGGTIDKKHPLIFYNTKGADALYVYDGTNDVIPQEILDNPSNYGFFLTEVPTMDSILLYRDNEYKCSYTKITKVRLGNLTGIYNEIFGTKQPYGYGLYSENVFLTGEFYLNNGKSVVDFSEESILLKYKNAGLEIRDVNPIEQVPITNSEGELVLDEFGEKTYRNKTEIYMNADQFTFSIANKPAMKLSGLFNSDGKVSDTFLDIQGWIQSNGLYIYPKGYISDPTKPKIGASCYITDEGNFYANNATLEGNIIAESGYIGCRKSVFNNTESGLQQCRAMYAYCKVLVETVDYNNRKKSKFVNLFKYPSIKNSDDENYLILNSEVKLLGDTFTVYYGGFFIEENSLSTVIGSYSSYENAKISLYNYGEPWINISSNNCTTRFGINVLPVSSGATAQCYINNSACSEGYYGMIINLNSINNTSFHMAGISISVKNKDNSVGTAIYAQGRIFASSYSVLNSDGTKVNGLNPDKTEELPDLDKIRISVRGGLIVGWRKE